MRMIPFRYNKYSSGILFIMVIFGAALGLFAYYEILMVSGIGKGPEYAPAYFEGAGAENCIGQFDKRIPRKEKFLAFFGYCDGRAVTLQKKQERRSEKRGKPRGRFPWNGDRFGSHETHGF